MQFRGTIRSEEAPAGISSSFLAGLRRLFGL
jgi:hypothetical protein